MAAAMSPQHGVGPRLSPNISQGLSQSLTMTPSLQQAMQLMAMRLGDIRKYALDLAVDNPFLEVQLPSMPRQKSPEELGFDFDRISHESQYPVTLASHVMTQIGVSFSNPDDRAIALLMVEHLAPYGWLEDGALSALTTRGVSRQDFDRILNQLQALEPVGVFARNLAECLSLQLADMGLLDDHMRLIMDHLDALHQGVETLAEQVGLSREDVARGLAKLRQCQPKPGANFIQDDGDIFHPDMVITTKENGFDVIVNQGMMPSVSVKDDGNIDDDASKLLFKKAQEDARMLSRGLARRQEMLLDCGRRLAQYQAAYLNEGEVMIKPLSMAILADEMGVHKSTISRVVADKLVDTPRGMLPLSDFFSPSVTQPDGSLVASRRIMALIRGYCKDEDPAHPLSDQDLTVALAEKGIIVARRTIAKYRQKAGFLGQAKRRHDPDRE